MLGRRGAIALACAAALIVPAAAHADAFDQVFHEYQTTGKVDGCKHSAAELQSAKAHVPNDIEQYAPDFPEALDAAAAKRAQGGCDKQAAAAATTAAPATTTAASPPATSQPAGAQPAGAQPAATATATTAAASAPAPQADPTPAPVVADDAIPVAATTAASSGSDVPVGLVVAGVLLLIVLALWGLARWWAWEPPWLVRWRHAMAEAGWRASAAWAEFTDWLRLGR